MKHSYKQLIASAVLAGLGVTALAQTTPSPAPREGRTMHDLRDARHGDRDPAQMRERMAKRMGALKQKLAITPAQEGALTAWTNAMKPPAQRMERPSRVEFARMTTPERIDRMRALRVQRQQQMDNRMDATKNFYAALNEQQQKTFDEESMRFLRGGGKRSGHRGHHRI